MAGTARMAVAAILLAGALVEASAAGGGLAFSGDSVTFDGGPSIRLSEKLPAAELRKRFPGYTVKLIEGDCGSVCILLTGKAGYLRIEYGDDGRVSQLYSNSKTAHDVRGNGVGASMRKAIGADTTNCDEGEETVCRSKALKGLSYVPGDDAACAPKEGKTSGVFAIPACATIAAFEIYR